MSAVTHEKALFGGALGYSNSLYCVTLLPEHRGVGLGTQLMGAFEYSAISLGAHPNEKGFCTRLGYTHPMNKRYLLVAPFKKNNFHNIAECCQGGNVNLQNVAIESERLLQRPISIEYADVIFACFDASVTKYMYPKPAERIQETHAFINDSIAGLKNGTNLQLVILKKENEEFVGCSGLHGVGKDDPELGVWTREDEHGHKYGFEAISSLIGWARENIDYHHLKYPVDRRNVASKRIPEINGGVVHREYKKPNMSGFLLDEVEYWIYK
jgi:[ribosomal protein S5]-alanine N-acetyltransferase